MTFAKTSRSIVRRSVAMLLGAAALASCDKNAVQDITAPLASSRVKFFNFGVNAPGVNFYANDQKITAITSATGTESTTGIAQGGVGSGGLYSALAPGQYNFQAKIAAATDKDLTVSNVNTTLENGKAYTFYTSGIYDATTKRMEGFVVEDAIPAVPEAGSASVRFVNAISNSVPMVLYARNTTTGTEVPVGAAIAYKSGGAFVTLPAGVYDLSTRAAGSTTNIVVRTGVSFVTGRIYTIASRGDITVTSTTSANRPQLDLTANR